MSQKPYDVGFTIGRFQTLHKGHQSLINIGKTLCDRMIVFFGSAQESGTERNPLNVATRMDMFREIYGGESEGIFIYALPDLSTEDDITEEWGKYLWDNVDRYVYKKPNLMIYGNDESRSKWFAPEDLKGVAELIVNRGDIPISATMVREAMAQDRRKDWMSMVDDKAHKMYDKIRGELMAVEFYQELAKNKKDGFRN